ncbi:MAG TPA: SDR family NAD(P)-dependent oxidoreductase [Nevskia sp.]|nr:SDR family NAD(P)-dependent oxidoreductase [Nevskia sp.]
MIRLQESIDSPRSARDCFFFAADFRNLPAWDPSTASVRKLSPGALGSGSQYDLVVSFGPQRLPMRYRVLEFDPPRRIVLLGEGEALSALDEIRFQPLAAGTRIIYTSDLTLKTVGRLTEQALKPIVGLNSRRSMAGLRRALAAEDAAPAPSAWRNLLDRSLLPGAAQFTSYGYRAARLRPIVDRLDGRTAVITGASSGIGRAAALWLARLGARVVLVGRDAGKLADTKADIVADCGNVEVAVQRADLLSLRQTRALARRLLDSEPRIDVLVNNAGALFERRELTAEGLERSFALNLLSPYVLTEALIPALPAGGRIVNVSSGGMYLQALQLDDLNYAQGRYSGTKAYARAKRGLVALGLDWAERLAPRGISAQVMHPGWVDTPGVTAALPRFHRAMRPLLRTPEQGADSIVWLAAAPAAASASGNFWLDRQPHLTDVLPGTTVHRKTRQDLRQALEEAANSASP